MSTPITKLPGNAVHSEHRVRNPVITLADVHAKLNGMPS